MLPVIDLAHRGLLFSLVGITAYGFYLGYAGHNARMERGKEYMARREEAERLAEEQKKLEKSLAQSAQSAIPGRAS
ncbi:hypothetical protein AGABI2DRAFT_136403 [Agaricus bisporus var. bisporus H97]|uniref:hypothetical protein n=1 Tax=Agaricus bisporus var. bisporus (strain H97 / ATCC MYA-4626 / FGSC 10389) TaxID=936046 RepID=UPI00029F5216|nr:hypothetical protein AGABI2DRAFT_136403 [Agaricus bisporus var. bisporus H97]EKV47728.1 hypothetical protein AGABI2DRAFT_136403 [Agaricus bisporus var. bisporus H97]